MTTQEDLILCDVFSDVSKQISAPAPIANSPPKATYLDWLTMQKTATPDQFDFK